MLHMSNECTCVSMIQVIFRQLSVLYEGLRSVCILSTQPLRNSKVSIYAKCWKLGVNNYHASNQSEYCANAKPLQDQDCRKTMWNCCYFPFKYPLTALKQTVDSHKRNKATGS